MRKPSRKARRQKLREAEREVRAIYAEIPRIDCKGLCHDSCGPIAYSNLEAAFIGPPRSVGEDCIHLRNGRCQIYQRRPSVCRMWGVVAGLECHHGCKPERLLTRDEAHTILTRLQLVSARYGFPGKAMPRISLDERSLLHFSKKKGLL